MVGNTLPAINDITVPELIAVVEDTARFCPTIKVYPQYTQSAVFKAFTVCTLLPVLHTAEFQFPIATVCSAQNLLRWIQLSNCSPVHFCMTSRCCAKFETTL